MNYKFLSLALTFARFEAKQQRKTVVCRLTLKYDPKVMRKFRHLNGNGPPRMYI